MKLQKLLLLTFIILFSLIFHSGFSQSNQNVLVMDGLVYGYSFDYSKKILKKEKQIKVEGVLENVSVDVLDEGVVIKSVQTNATGVFSLKLKIDQLYFLKFSKPGFSSIYLTVDLTSVPKERASKGITFSGAEIILNSFQSKGAAELNLPFGRLFYNTDRNYLDFEVTKDLTKKQKEYINNPASLMLRSVQKNINNVNVVADETISKIAVVKSPLSTEVKSIDAPQQVNIVVSSPEKNYNDNINKILTEFKQKSKAGIEKATESDIQSLEVKIKEARIQFEKDKLNASSAEDSLVLKEQEYLLNSVEQELVTAKKLIEFQKGKISTQRQLLYLAIACVLLLSGLLFIIFRFNQEKKKTYNLLKDKNKKITDSIAYALRIQESILPTDAEIKKQLPKSFIYFQPRDTVSGDFYWLSSIKDKTIIACVDCTGHGVPGAFMSLIGNTLLNEIVNEKQIINPAQILKRLHQEVVKALHQDTDRVQSKDGMEMSLCVIDEKANEIEFSGAMNPLYLVKDDVVSIVKPDTKGIGGDSNPDKEIEFTNQIIPIQKNMSVYMFTDGYMDQFGGPENKKFNIPNFKKMLLEMQTVDMNKQRDVLEKTIQSWQGKQRQVDDILVIGMRF